MLRGLEDRQVRPGGESFDWRRLELHIPPFGAIGLSDNGQNLKVRRIEQRLQAGTG